MDHRQANDCMLKALLETRAFNRARGRDIAWEYVEEAMIALIRYQATRSAPALLRHAEYAGRLPRELKNRLAAIAKGG